jgi:hypothetical protein
MSERRLRGIGAQLGRKRTAVQAPDSRQINNLRHVRGASVFVGRSVLAFGAKSRLMLAACVTVLLASKGHASFKRASGQA